MKIVVIGGSAAGAKAVAKARRLDQKAEITIIQREATLSMASCGYPYYVGGTFSNRNALLTAPNGVVRDEKFFAKTKDITAHVETECIAIDTEKKYVTCRKIVTGEEFELAYDKLVIATGAQPRRLPIEGVELAGVSHLLSMDDTDYLHKIASEQSAKEAVIIGGGLIGVEACEALVARGIKVTLLEMDSQILAMLDWQLATLVANHMKTKGVDIRVSSRVNRFVGRDAVEAVELSDGTKIPCQLVVMATGVQPAVGLAQSAGLQIGERGGIVVDHYMQTSDANIYAAGDCVECTHMITGEKVLAPMGDLANLQGRVAGENIVCGNSEKFSGTIQTAICKVFAFTAGVTGLTEKQAKRLGLEDVETVVHASPDKPGFMGAALLISKMLVQKSSGKILGYQCVGSGDVSRQIATAAMALRGELGIESVVTADLPYAPPFSTAIDHFIAAAHLMQNKLKGRLKSIAAEEVKAMMDAGEKPFIIDARGPDEYEQIAIGMGENYIPMGAIRDSLSKLPAEKATPVICYCKIGLRGYEAALAIEANGWTNVRVMEGGVMGWPFARVR